MDDLFLKAESRSLTGTATCRRLRHTGMVPGVVYGHGQLQNVSFNLHAFTLLLHRLPSEHAVVKLHLDDNELNVLIKDVQRHVVTHTIIHIDFLIVDLDETVRVTIPVVVQGESNGVKNFNGVLELVEREIEIECKAGVIPDSIIVDVTPLDVHDVIRINELPVLDGISYTGDPETTVITIAPPTVQVDTDEQEGEDEETAAEPVVLTAKAPEES